MFDKQQFLEATHDAVLVLHRASADLADISLSRDGWRLQSASLSASLVGAFGRNILATAGIDFDPAAEPTGDLSSVVQRLIDELPWDANWSWSDWLFEVVQVVQEIEAATRLPLWPEWG